KESINTKSKHKPEAKHNQQHERTAVAYKCQPHTGNWQHLNRHSDVLEDVREDKCRDPDDQKQTELVPGEKGDEQTRHQEQGECADQKDPADKSPLLADCRENVVVMHSRSG